MGFLKRLAGNKAQVPATPSPSPAPYHRDLFAGDDVARSWLDRLAAGKWLEYVDFLAAQPDYRSRDWYLRVAVRGFKGRPKWIEAWPTAQPTSAHAFLLRGAQAVNWAWETRGGARAADTPREAFDAFHERLELARRDLLRAAELAPEDPSPWAELLPVAMGLGTSIPERHHVYARVREREPWHWTAPSMMVKAVAQKWGGSHDEMFTFARNISEHAPEGSTVHEVIADAYYEFALDEKAASIQTDEARTEIAAAAARSIDLRLGDRDPYVLLARSQFALTYWLARDLDRLRAEIVELEPIVTGPWLNFESPIGYWKGAREDAGLDPEPANPTAS